MIAVIESVNNAIKHGNQSDTEKFVHVSIRLSEKFFKATVTDQGSGFDLAKVPDPIAEENLDKCSGRGVMLIKHFVDEAEYNEEGNSVCLKKTRTKPN
jgi:serine/threonine-protein kinase RsbW